MPDLILKNPDLATYVLYLSGIFIGVLLSAIGYLLKRSIDQLNTTIKELTTGQKTIREDMEDINDRLITQITVCEMCRKNCPMNPINRGKV